MTISFASQTFNPPIATIGSQVAVLGSGFLSVTGVTFPNFEGQSATFTIVSDNLVIFTVPNDAISGPVGFANPGAIAVSNAQLLISTVTSQVGVNIFIAPADDPENLVATPVGSDIFLTWNLTPNTSCYNVYRATISGAETLYATCIQEPYTDVSVMPGVTYYYKVQSSNSSGTSGLSNEAFAGIATTPLSAPNNLGAVCNLIETPFLVAVCAPDPDSVATLNWTNVASAFCYNVYSATTSGDETLLESGVIGTTYIDDSVTPGETYYYKVTAITAAGEGSKSNEASLLCGIPGAPSSLSASCVSGNIHLTWTAGAGANTYNIYRGTTSGGETLHHSGVSPTNYTDTVTSNITYYYKVTSVNGNGESSLSNEANAECMACTPPNQVTGLDSSCTSEQVTLTWTASTGSPAATSYNIYRGTTSGGETLLANCTTCCSGSSCTYVDDSGSGTWYYKVTALATACESSFSGAPETNTVCSSGTPSLWVTDTTDGSVWGITTSGSATPYTLTGSSPLGIAAGPDGNLWVASAVGTSNPNNAVWKVTTAGIPTKYENESYQPYAVCAGNDGNMYFLDDNDAVLLQVSTSGTYLNHYSFPTPTDGGSSYTTEFVCLGPDNNLWVTATSGFNGYVIKITTSGVFTPYVLSTIANPQGICAGPDGNLWTVDGSTYPIGSVWKVTTSGVAIQYSTLTGSSGSSPYGICVGPDNNLWVADSNAGIGVWMVTTSGVATQYPQTNTSFDSICAGPDSNLWAVDQANGLVWKITTSGVGTPYTITGTAYSLGYICPGPGLALTVEPRTGGDPTINLIWNPTVGATCYNIYRGTTSGDEILLVGCVSSGSNSYADSTAVNNTTYYYKITAVRGADESGFSNEVNAQCGGTSTPAILTNVTATVSGNIIYINWSPSVGASCYNIYRSTTSGDEVLYASCVMAPYPDTNVTVGTTYYYTVTAINSNGESGQSTQVSAEVSGSVPTIPSDLSADCVSGHIELSWAAIGGATCYNVYRGLVSGSETLYALCVATNSYTDTSITSEVTYFYTVTTVSSGGESGFSNEALAQCGGASVPPPTLPALPSLVVNLIALCNQGITLYWVASPGALAYNIYRSTSSGGETLYVAGIKANYFYDIGATPGTTYYYKITAANSGGESVVSSEVSAGCLAVPLPPVLSISVSDFTATLSWPAVSGALSYNLYSGFTSNSEVLLTNQTELTYILPLYNIEVGDVYVPTWAFFFRITAVNSNGESAYSNEVNVESIAAQQCNGETNVESIGIVIQDGLCAGSYSAIWNGEEYVVPVDQLSDACQNCIGGDDEETTLTFGNPPWSCDGNSLLANINGTILYNNCNQAWISQGTCEGTGSGGPGTGYNAGNGFTVGGPGISNNPPTIAPSEWPGWGLQVVPAPGFIALGWIPICGATSYIVLRNGSALATTSLTYYSDYSAEPGVTYGYQVQAIGPGGASNNLATEQFAQVWPQALAVTITEATGLPFDSSCTTITRVLIYAGISNGYAQWIYNNVADSCMRSLLYTISVADTYLDIGVISGNTNGLTPWDNSGATFNGGPSFNFISTFSSGAVLTLTYLGATGG